MLFGIQTKLGVCVMDAVYRCRQTFMKKSSRLMDKEIEVFLGYHNDFYAYTKCMEEYRTTPKDT